MSALSCFKRLGEKEAAGAAASQRGSVPGSSNQVPLMSLLGINCKIC